MGFCEPIAVARSQNSTALLRRSGIHCRAGDLSDPETAKRILCDCSLVFDLALPLGKNLRETKYLLRRRLNTIFTAISPECRFILASTTSVFRFSNSQPFFRAYASMKLFSERQARKLGRKRNVDVYIFRLGQVHGLMQACSASIKKALVTERGPFHVPDQESNAIFVVSIAEAVKIVLNKQVPTNVYTLLSHPRRTFGGLVEVYSRQLGIVVQINYEPAYQSSPATQAALSIRRWLYGGISAFVEHYKELLSALVGGLSVELEKRLRFKHTRKVAASAINSYRESLTCRLFEPLCEIPGNRFPFENSTIIIMHEYDSAVVELLTRARRTDALKSGPTH